MEKYEKLIRIQTELSCPKNQRNNFANYNFRSCEDILEALKPLAKELKVYLLFVDSIESVNVPFEITETTKDIKTQKETIKHIIAQGRVYIKSIATLYDNDGTIIAQATGLAREEETKKGQDASQLTGATSSYSRKYACNSLFNLDDNKDSDSTNKHGKDKEIEKPFPMPKPIAKVTKEEIAGDFCDVCKEPVTPDVKKFSLSKYNCILCRECQKTQ